MPWGRWGVTPGAPYWRAEEENTKEGIISAKRIARGTAGPSSSAEFGK